MPIGVSIRFLLALLTAAIILGPRPAQAQRERQREPQREQQQEPQRQPQREPQNVPAREIPDPERRARTGIGPQETLRRFETAWRKEDVAGIVALIGEGRVFVDVRGIGRQGGWFSRAQVQYLFRSMFESHTQTRFEFVQYHNLDKDDRKVFGIAYRSFRNKRSGNLFHDKVYVTLDREGSAWVVVEIKTTR